ncbi:MAG TPA: HD domain-containing protein, partial [Acidobacteriota bacterium]|nr:HD domain-containing protein [Acidobacteriota bacterium]
DGGNWDFTGFRNHTLDGDLRKRDFTINAMALRWEDFYPERHLDKVIDPCNGSANLEKKIISAVSEQSLRDDPLRMLRAFRLEAELKFQIDPQVRAQISELHPLIRNVATERIREELDRIFLQSDSAEAWRSIGNSSLFVSLIPEMAPMKSCEQGGYHHLDVWEHTLSALERFEALIPIIPDVFPENASQIQEYLSSTGGTLDRKRLLKWGILFHDIGKPQTRELGEPGRWRFHGHEHVGTDIAQGILKHLKFARKDIQIVGSLIEHHLRPLNLFNQEDQQEDAYYRFFRATGTEGIGVLLMAYGDIAAARGPLVDQERDSQFIAFIRELIRYYYDEYYPKVNTPELLKGRDLMAFLQMKPGPKMGKLLKEIRESQLEGKLHNRQDALEFASNWLTKNP